jgi:hypothetical protein
MPTWHLQGGGERDKPLGRPPGLRPRILGEVFLTRTTAASLVFCAIARLYLAKKSPFATPGPVRKVTGRFRVSKGRGGNWLRTRKSPGRAGAFGFLRSVHAHRRDDAMRPLVGNSYGRMRTAGHAAPRVPPLAEADGGGAPTGVEAGATCGRGGESHAASGQIALLAQLGQLSRPVNNTSQSRQHQASASRIGPWHHGVPDSLDSGMAHPPRTPPPPASSAGGSGPDSWCCLRAGS